MTEHRSKISGESSPGNHPSNTVPGGMIGAIVIHLIVIALAFAQGFLFGASLPLGHAPTADGFTGGEYAIQTVLLFYFASIGIIPIVLSGIGYLIGRRLARRLPGDADPITGHDSNSGTPSVKKSDRLE